MDPGGFVITQSKTPIVFITSIRWLHGNKRFSGNWYH